MKNGAWHQCGDKTQSVALELAQMGVGSGVVISPRDIPLKNARQYAVDYREANVCVIVDHQFYNPSFLNKQMATYPDSQFRPAITLSRRPSSGDLSGLARAISSVNEDLQTSAIVAPALAYDGGVRQTYELNEQLFDTAREAGAQSRLPVFATVMLSKSTLASESSMLSAVSSITKLQPDGWYFGAEFGDERIPSDGDRLLRFCQAGILLSLTGKPVFHAFAGPLALLSRGFGARACGIGQSQNLWKFSPGARWSPPSSGGGGGAPPRFFSRELWGTVVYSDETASLPTEMRGQILRHSPFSVNVRNNLTWTRWDANKHLVYEIASVADNLLKMRDPRDALKSAKQRLLRSCELYAQIRGRIGPLSDMSDSYQRSWISVIDRLLTVNADDLELLAVLGD